MEEGVLQEILKELKGIRSGLDSANSHLIQLNSTINIQTLETQAIKNDLKQLKEIMGEKAIWENDFVKLSNETGTLFQGVIRKGIKGLS